MGRRSHTELVTSASPVRRAAIDELTGLRFVAALVVVFSHLPELVPFGDLSNALVRQAPGGVTTFFVLSGVVLTYNYRAQFAASLGGTTAFFRARLARIVPVHLLSVALIIPLVLTDDEFHYSTTTAAAWAANVGLVHAFVPAKAFHVWNIPSWSVSTELVFYAAFPLFIYFVISRLRRDRSLIALGLVFVAASAALYGVVAAVAERSLSASGKDPETIAMMLERLKFFPLLRIWEFFLGCVIGEALLRWKASPNSAAGLLRTRRRRHVALAVALAGFIAAPIISVQFGSSEPGLVAHFFTAGLYVWYAPCAALLVFALASGPTVVSPLLANPQMVRLGDASFAFYMLQWPVVLLIERYGPQPPTWWFSSAVVVGLALVSIATMRWFETPARTYLRGRQFGVVNVSARSTTRVAAPSVRSG